MEALRRCAKCVLLDTIPNIEFDDDGVCNHCRNHISLQYKGEVALKKKLDRHRDNGREYNCIVALSGGRDSSFALWKMVKEHGMRVLAVNYENPFTSPQAKVNIQRAVETLQVDLVSFKLKGDIHRRCFRNNVLAWFHNPSPAMIPMMCIACKTIWSEIFEIARKNGITCMVYGGSKFEASSFKKEFMGVRWDVGRQSVLYARRLYQGIIEQIKNPRYITVTTLPVTIKGYLHFHPTSPYLRWRYPEIDRIALFAYIEWDEQKVIPTISNELGWQKDPDNESLWRFDCKVGLIKDYMYLTSAGFTEKDDLYSKMIREGLMTREAALDRLAVENQIDLDVVGGILSEVGLNLSDLIRLRSSQAKRRAQSIR